MEYVKRIRTKFQDDIRNDIKVFSTDTLIDEYLGVNPFKNEKGIIKGSKFLMTGSEGSGKSTVSLDIMSKLKKNYKDIKILYISSEMSEKAITINYSNRIDNLDDLDFLFYYDMSKDKNLDLEEIIINTLDYNWDLIIVDSYFKTRRLLFEYLYENNSKLTTIIVSKNRYNEKVDSLPELYMKFDNKGVNYLEPEEDDDYIDTNVLNSLIGEIEDEENLIERL
jgi:hypothetical protein